jgi:4-amino-4-deoxychorismate lyase
VPHASQSLVYAATINPLTDDLSSFGLLVYVYLDTDQTPSSIFTSTKTTNRQHYDAARARLNIPPLGSALPIGQNPSDVLLRNTDNQVTETSIRNIAFYRANHWVTPSSVTGCLPGITRRLLLDQALVIEGDLYSDDVNRDEIVLLFNAVEGCRLGRITAFIK